MPGGPLTRRSHLRGRHAEPGALLARRLARGDVALVEHTYDRLGDDLLLLERFHPSPHVRRAAQRVRDVTLWRLLAGVNEPPAQLDDVAHWHTAETHRLMPWCGP